MTRLKKRLIFTEPENVEWNIKIKFAKVTGKEDDMRTNYIMVVDDVMEELGVKRSKAYSILKQLNNELEAEGYVAVRGKIPRPYWETKFYGFSRKSM